MLAADLTLLLAAAGSALWAYRTRTACQESRVLLGSWALACAFIALAVLGQLLPSGPSQDLAVVRRMGLNLGVFIGLPFLAAALVSLGRRWFWSAAAWGRLMLGLFAAFELSRQLGYGLEYTQLLGAASALAMLYASTRLANGRARLTGLSGATLLAAALALTSPLAFAIGPDAVSFRLLTALSLLLLSAALHSEHPLQPQRG